MDRKYQVITHNITFKGSVLIIMTSYLLDTNHCVYIINGLDKAQRSEEESNVIKTIRKTKSNIYISDVTLGELYFGAEHSSNPDYNLNRIELFKHAVIQIPVSENIWKLFAKIKSSLQKQGKIIPDLDILIACTAKTFDITLVTNDSHFNVLPTEFKITNWTK